MTETTWRISTRTAFVVTTPERVVVLNLEHPQEQPRALLGTAAAIWLQLAAGREHHGVGEPELLGRLAEQFSTTVEAIAPDVASFLEEMGAGGYLLKNGRRES